MEVILSSPLFGIFMCLISIEIGRFLNKKIKSPLANPMLIALMLVIGVLVIFDIPYKYFANGAKFITIFLSPVTAVLAVNIYKQVELLKQNAIPIIAGCAAGSIASIISVLTLCSIWGVESIVTTSMFTKSVTSAIAIPLTEQFGGIASITAASVMITGICGSMFAPYLVRLFAPKDGVAAGLALGTSSHALGTSAAVELGEIESAMSGLAMGITGLITVIIIQVLCIFT